MEQRGLAWEGIDAALQTPLDESIMAVMEGRSGAWAIEHARRAVDDLRARGVDGIVLGCTEIPLLLAANLDDPDLVNPWGISLSGGSPFWVANNGTGTSTLYAGDHVSPPTPLSKNGLVAVSYTHLTLPTILRV